MFTETGHPIPRTVLDRIACDSEVTRIVFGPDSEVLDVGRTHRVVTPAHTPRRHRPRPHLPRARAATHPRGSARSTT